MGYSWTPLSSLTSSNSCTHSLPHSSKVIFGRFLNLKNWNMQVNILIFSLNLFSAYILMVDGWESSGPPITIMPLSLTLPVNLQKFMFSGNCHLKVASYCKKFLNNSEFENVNVIFVFSKVSSQKFFQKKNSKFP